MLRWVGSAIGALILAGISLALLNNFNWDVGALLMWAVGIYSDLVNAVADWFTSMPIFQKMVSR